MLALCVRPDAPKPLKIPPRNRTARNMWNAISVRKRTAAVAFAFCIKLVCALALQTPATNADLNPSSWVKEAGSPKRRGAPSYSAAGRVAAASGGRRRWQRGSSKVLALDDGNDADADDDADDDAWTDASDGSMPVAGPTARQGPAAVGLRLEEAKRRDERSRQLAASAMGIGVCACVRAWL